MSEQERETTGPGGDNLSDIGSQFRQAAGLPARENDSPITNNPEVSERRIAREPEGGYGGEDGITGTGAMTTDEERHLERREASVADEEGEVLTGGETATEEARVTGEDVTDVKPAGEATDATEGGSAREDQE